MIIIQKVEIEWYIDHIADIHYLLKLNQINFFSQKRPVENHFSFINVR